VTVTRSRDFHRELWKKYNQTVTFWITELLLPGIEQGLWITKVLPLERGLDNQTVTFRSAVPCPCGNPLVRGKGKKQGRADG